MGDRSGDDDRETDTDPDIPGPSPVDDDSDFDLASSAPTELARGLLERVRRKERTEQFRQSLADLNEPSLSAVRTERQTALAFWLNVYNAAVQLLLDRRPALFESRWRFFRAPAVTVAGVELSLDDIELGILRGRKSKYGLGYLPRLGRTGLSAAYRLDADPRIHFALNCGAVSCPAVLAYTPETVDETLDNATETYLNGTVEYDADRDRVTLPRVCLWFVGDFGGRSGLRSFLREFGQIPTDATPSLRFHEYNWRKAPRKFADRRRQG
nr:DUF547 domain-containing protein [Halococcus hamelinensis]